MASGYGDFYEVFARFYDAIRPEREGEIAFYLDQARGSERPALEIGCGTGRVLLPIAESGKEIWGIDSSPAMLGVLEGKLARMAHPARKGAVRVTLRRGDMRSFSLGRLFDLVTIPYHTFQHLTERDEQIACLECIRAHLGSRGRLAMDVAGFDPSVLPGRRGAIRVERRALFRDPDVAGTLETVFTAQIDRASGRALQTRTLRRGADELLRASTVVQYLREGELAELLEASGFLVLDHWGGFRGEPSESGGEQVWIAERS